MFNEFNIQNLKKKWFDFINNNLSIYQFSSIKLDQLDKINAELESDSIIKSIHDVKGIDMGSNMIRYKVWHFLSVEFSFSVDNQIELIG